jgi:hypothetical protein
MSYPQPDQPQLPLSLLILAAIACITFAIIIDSF